MYRSLRPRDDRGLIRKAVELDPNGPFGQQAKEGAGTIAADGSRHRHQSGRRKKEVLSVFHGVHFRAGLRVAGAGPFFVEWGLPVHQACLWFSCGRECPSERTAMEAGQRVTAAKRSKTKRGRRNGVGKRHRRRSAARMASSALGYGIQGVRRVCSPIRQDADRKRGMPPATLETPQQKTIFGRIATLEKQKDNLQRECLVRKKKASRVASSTAATASQFASRSGENQRARAPQAI